MGKSRKPLTPKQWTARVLDPEARRLAKRGRPMGPAEYGRREAIYTAEFPSLRDDWQARVRIASRERARAAREARKVAEKKAAGGGPRGGRSRAEQVIAGRIGAKRTKDIEDRYGIAASHIAARFAVRLKKAKPVKPVKRGKFDGEQYAPTVVRRKWNRRYEVLGTGKTITAKEKSRRVRFQKESYRVGVLSEAHGWSRSETRAYLARVRKKAASEAKRMRARAVRLGVRGKALDQFKTARVKRNVVAALMAQIQDRTSPVTIVTGKVEDSGWDEDEIDDSDS